MNHTIQLINANALDGIDELISANKWVDCILTKFDREYFYDDTIEETTIALADHFSAVLVSDGSVYVQVDLKDIPLVSYNFCNHGFKLQNILTVPVVAEVGCYHAKRYVDDNIIYFLFFTRSDSPARYFNPTDNGKAGCMCHYPITWDWFKGDIIAAYREMLKISTDHADVVLDPFMNYGDTGVATIDQDRHYIGIEISRARYEDAKRRLDENGE